MKASSNESATSREVRSVGSWSWKNPWKHIFFVFQVSMFLVLVAGVSRRQSGMVGEASEALFPSYLPQGGDIEPSFCLEGAVMTQLLQGFGSEMLASKVSGYHLNCGARILREEFIGDQAILDVELDCECVDPDAGSESPMRVTGQWNLSFDL